MPTTLPASRRSLLGRRVMSRAAGMEPRSAGKLRDIALRLIRGEEIPPAVISEAFPERKSGRGEALSIGYKIDWDRGEVSLGEAYQKVNRLAIMDLCGPVYFGACWWEVLLLGANPTNLVVEALNQAADDGSIDALLVVMNCEGGSVAGAYDLAAALDRVKAAGKRLLFVSSEMIFSMGMWMAAAADRVYTTPTGMLGSVGTLIPIYDDSAFFADLGIVPKFIASDPHKGVGMPGTEITEENTADLRRIVDKHFAEFAARVASGRGMSVEAVIATRAGIYMAQDAVDIGFADEVIQTVDGLIASLSNGALPPARAGGPSVEAPEIEEDPPASPEEPEPMDLKTAKPEDVLKERPDLADHFKAAGKTEAQAAAPKPATLADLKAAFPGAENSLFREDCLEKSLTVDQAKIAHGERAGTELAAVQAKLAASEAKVGELLALNGAGAGTKPVSGAAPKTGGTDLGTPPGPDSSDEDRRAYAKSEWDANANGCREGRSEKGFIAFRAAQLGGNVRIHRAGSAS